MPLTGQFSLKEADIITKIPSHPNIIKYEDVFQSEDKVVLVMDYAH